MGWEIELKFRSPDPQAVRARLQAGARLLGPYLKSDTYFRLGAQTFRLREAGGRAVVCRKLKTLTGGVEVNREVEFSVDDAAAFAAFAQALGAEPWYVKTKTGNAWQWGRVLIEEGTVSDLGWFAELEIVLPEDSPETERARAREDLFEVLRLLGGEAGLEPRPYAELLGYRPPTA